MGRTSFFDCMIVTNGRKSCKASELYTKKDPFISHPQRTSDLSKEEKDAQKEENFKKN